MTYITADTWTRAVIAVFRAGSLDTAVALLLRLAEYGYLFINIMVMIFPRF